MYPKINTSEAFLPPGFLPYEVLCPPSVSNSQNLHLSKVVPLFTLFP